jgi:DNA (cytosine-5)-methyltransferase 1
MGINNTRAIYTTMRAISLFSGMGGDSLGMVNAGLELVAYSEKEKTFRETHDLNFPNSTALGTGDITQIPDETFVRYANNVDMIFAGFPCFFKWTRVATDSGYKNIEDVTPEMQLLTHTGVFRPIINIQTKMVYDRSLYNIKYKGHFFITCTEDHPFYIRTRDESRSFGEPHWKPAKELTEDDYAGMVINRLSVCPTLIIESKSVKLEHSEQWFLMGYFVANGHLEPNNKIILNMTNNTTLSIISRIFRFDGVEIGYNKYEFTSYKWYNIFKLLKPDIPEWVHDAPVEHVTQFIAGFGVPPNDNNNLSLHIDRLKLKIGFSTNAVIDGNYAWYPLDGIYTQKFNNEPVYNFEVAEDNSYIVENLIVHNCQGFSQAGKRKDDDVRNTLFSQFLRATRLTLPSYIIGENVKGLLTRKMSDGQLYIDVIASEFEKLGYIIKYKVVKTEKYGIPQKRERLLIIGSRTGTEPEFPCEIPGIPNLLNIVRFDMTGSIKIEPDDFDMTTIPAECILTDLENDETEQKPHPYLRMKAKTRNEIYADKTHYNQLSFGKRDSPIHCEIIDIRKPSKTIICTYEHQPRLFVPLRNKNGYFLRCLLPDELKQIQGFPADYKIAGSLKQQIIQIGNAVPPGLIKLVAERLTKQN